MSDAFTYEFAGGVTLSIPPAEVASFERAWRAYRHASKPPRNLIAEIAAYLAEHPGALVLEIARGISTRDDDVRRALREGPFQAVCRSGASGKGIGYYLAPSGSQVVPEGGTSAQAVSPT